MFNRVKSIVLVGLQFLFIFLLLPDYTMKKISALSYVFFILSFLLVFWSIVTMQKSKLRIFPEPAANASLITDGPYRFIRHPMYTAILLAATGLLCSYFTWFRLTVAIALLIVLIIKLLWEEKMLSRKFVDYSNYKKHTARLFPFLL